MRKYVIVIVAVILAAGLILGFDYSIPAVQQGTVQLLRVMAGEDPNTAHATASVTLATAGDWGSKPAEANGLKILVPGKTKQSDVRNVLFMACGRAAADKTFTVKYWGWFDQGPAKLLASVAYTLGTQKVVKYPGGATIADAYWADTAVVTSYWPLGVVTSDDQGDNGVAMVLVNAIGLDCIYAEVLSCDGSTGTEAAEAAIYWYGY